MNFKNFHDCKCRYCQTRQVISSSIPSAEQREVLERGHPFVTSDSGWVAASGFGADRTLFRKP